MMAFWDIARSLLDVAAVAGKAVPGADEKYLLKQRQEGPWIEGPCFWFHGASLGECKVLLNLAEFLQRDVPNFPQVLITTQKAEVVSYLQEHCHGKIASAIAPLDSPKALKKFMLQVRPIGLVLAENELWPGYLSSMRCLNVRPSIALISGRFRNALPAMDYSGLGFVSTQTERELSRLHQKARYQKFNEEMVGGNWKLLPWAFECNAVLPSRENLPVDVTFGSLHLNEWKGVRTIVMKVVAQNGTVVVAPRRMEEADAFKKALQQENIPVLSWPEIKAGAVSIVESFGHLKEVYSQSKTAVMGGSFVHNPGVHDFWEPIQMGVTTFVGPYVKGQEDMAEVLLRAHVLKQIRQPEDFTLDAPVDLKVISNYLEEEKKKIQKSYMQLKEFLQRLM